MVTALTIENVDTLLAWKAELVQPAAFAALGNFVTDFLRVLYACPC